MINIIKKEEGRIIMILRMMHCPRYWSTTHKRLFNSHLIAKLDFSRQRWRAGKGITTNAIVSACKGRDLTGVLDLLRRKMELRQNSGKPQSRQLGTKHNHSSMSGKHRMLKNVSLQSMSDDIINEQNKFQHKISAIVKEYKEVQRRPLDFKLFLQTLARSRPFFGASKE